MSEQFDYTNELINDGPTSIEEPVEPAANAFEPDEPDGDDEFEPADEGDEENKTETDDTIDDPDPDAPLQEVRAPGRFNAQERALFAKLPPDLQAPVADIFRREQAKFTKANQDLRGYQSRYDAIEQILAPRRQSLAMSGLREDQVVSQLFALSDYANARPIDFLKWFCDTNKIDPQALLSQQQPEYIDPELKKRDEQWSQRYAALEHRLNEVTGKLGSRETAELRQRQMDVRTQIQKFRAARGQDGQPLHPHFDAVEEEMALYVSRDPAMSLDDAYDRAVHANPSTRKQLQAQDRQRHTDEQRKRSEKARRAGSSVSGNDTSTIRRQTQGGSVADSLSEAWDAALHGSL